MADQNTRTIVTILFFFFVEIPRVTIRYDTKNTGTYIVNDILLRVLVIRSWLVHRTYYVHLIVFERRVVLVHVYYMVCVVYSKSVTEKQTIVNNIECDPFERDTSLAY